MNQEFSPVSLVIVVKYQPVCNQIGCGWVGDADTEMEAREEGERHLRAVHHFEIEEKFSPGGRGD